MQSNTTTNTRTQLHRTLSMAALLLGAVCRRFVVVRESDENRLRHMKPFACTYSALHNDVAQPFRAALAAALQA